MQSPSIPLSKEKLRLIMILASIATLVGLVSLIATEVQGGSNPVNRSLSILFTIVNSMILLVPSPLKMRVTKVSVIITLMLMFLSWIYSLYGNYGSDISTLSLYGVSLGLMVYFSFQFAIFEANQALLYTIGEILCLLVITLPHSFTTFGGDLAFDGLILLVEVIFGYGSLTLLLYYFANLETQLIIVNQEAEHLTTLAFNDQLTAIPNRHSMEALLKQAIADAEKKQTAFSIMMLDLDHFKKVNDTYGHQVGDKVLQQFAHALKSHLRIGDILGRWGGEEFLIITFRTDQSNQHILASRLKDKLKQSDFEVKALTFSAGMTAYRLGDTPETLIHRADIALYQAKRKGRDRIDILNEI